MWPNAPAPADARQSDTAGWVCAPQDAASLFEWTADRATSAAALSWDSRQVLARGFFELWNAYRTAGRSAATIAATQRLLVLANRTQLDDALLLGKQRRARWRAEAANFLTARGNRSRVSSLSGAEADLGFGSSDDDV